MQQVKIIFENDENGEDKRFGYIIDKATLSYKTVQFDKRYEPYEIHESKPIGDLRAFGKSMWRLIKISLQTSE